MKTKSSIIAIAILIGSQQMEAQYKCQCPPTSSTSQNETIWKAITVKKKYAVQQVQRGWLSHTSITKYYIVGKDNKAYIVNRVEDWMVCEVGGIMWTDNGTSAQIKKRRYEFLGD
jgi:hypothetical protein